MRDIVQERILQALTIALRPVIRALLRAGIGYEQFSEISKSTYVEISTNDYGQRGRPTSLGRVVVMTGLPRKEVRCLRDNLLTGISSTNAPPSPMAKTLHRWHTHKDFLTESGTARELKYEEGTFNFSDLVRACSGDIPPGAMRTELVRINAVVESTDGRLRAIKKTVSGSETHELLISGLNELVYPAALALLSKSDNDGTWINRVVETRHVRAGDLSRLKKISTDRLHECAESISDLYRAYETLYGDDIESGQQTVGVSVFCFEATTVNN